MPRFSYKARDSAGVAVESSVEAPSRKDAVRLLSARGLSVAAVAEAPAGPAQKSAAAGRAAKAPAPVADPVPGLRGDLAPRRSDRLPFLEALHDLTTSGLSAGEAVRLLSIRIREPRQRILCEGLWARLSEGAPLSRAMAAFPQVFDPSTVNLIHAGEATGSLNDTLARLIEHLTQQKELRQAILTAMAYPALLVTVSGGVVLFFLFFLLPRLQSLLRSLGGHMPLSTRILVGLASFTLHYGIFVVLAAALVGFAIWWVLGRDA